MALAKTVTRVFPTESRGSQTVGIHLVLTDDDRPDLGSGTHVVIDELFTMDRAIGTPPDAKDKIALGQDAQAAIDKYKRCKATFASAAYETARAQIDEGVTL